MGILCAGICKGPRRMRWHGIEVVVTLLNVFAVIALGTSKPNRRSFKIGSRPFHSADEKARVCIRDQQSQQTVFAPTIARLRA